MISLLVGAELSSKQKKITFENNDDEDMSGVILDKTLELRQVRTFIYLATTDDFISPHRHVLVCLLRLERET